VLLQFKVVITISEISHYHPQFLSFVDFNYRSGKLFQFRIIKKYFEVGGLIGFSGKTKRKFDNGIGQNEKSEIEIKHKLKVISLGSLCLSSKISNQPFLRYF
jgi:hypothetical protein